MMKKIVISFLGILAILSLIFYVNDKSKENTEGSVNKASQAIIKKIDPNQAKNQEKNIKQKKKEEEVQKNQKNFNQEVAQNDFYIQSKSSDGKAMLVKATEKELAELEKESNSTQVLVTQVNQDGKLLNVIQAQK
jgi:hypothetical protein